MKVGPRDSGARGYELCASVDDTAHDGRPLSVRGKSICPTCITIRRRPNWYQYLVGALVAALVSFIVLKVVAHTAVPKNMTQKMLDLEQRSIPHQAVVMTTIESEMSPGKAARVAKVGRDNVTVTVKNGRCLHVYQKFPVNVGGTALGDALEHVVCYTTEHEEFHVIADVSRSSKESVDEGEFGFGQGVAVSLRPDPETDAIWRMQAGATSLGLKLDDQKAFQMIGLKVVVGHITKDVPLVVVRPRITTWPVDMALGNSSIGDCEPEITAKQSVFVCRTKSGVAKRVDLVAFCAYCTGEGSSYAMETRVWDASTKSAAVASSGRLPWIRWSVDIPKQGVVKTWRLSLQRTGQEPSAFPKDFEIFLVSGTTHVPITIQFPGSVFIQAASVWMFAIATLAFLMLVLATVTSLFCLSGPVCATLPSANYAIAALQILVLLGASDHVPIQFREFQRDVSGLLPKDPVDLIFTCAGILCFVAVAHAISVLVFVGLNGKGAGSNVPHSLLFGSWELRAIPFIALPLSYASSTMVINHSGCFQMRAINIVSCGWALLGASIMVSLLTLCIIVLVQIHSNIRDERVIKIPFPGTNDVIFIDRACDQLRAVPMCPGQSYFSSNWLAHPGFLCAPTVAKIREVHHIGTPPPRVGIGSSRAVWPLGPWELSVEGKDGANEGRGRWTELASKSSVPLRSSVSPSPADSSRVYSENLSQISKEHPVPAHVVFASKTCDALAIAGLMCLPWVDVAVPAADLRLISTVGGAENPVLFSHVGQLTGSISGGRLSACFEWTDRVAWRLPIDILIKVFLGVYISCCPVLSNTSIPYMLAAHGFVAVTALVLSALTLYGRPHHVMFENVSLAVVFILVSLTSCYSSSFSSQSTNNNSISICYFGVVFVCVVVPLLFLLVTSLLLGFFVLKACSVKSAKEAAPLVIREWDQESLKTKNRKYAVARVLVDLADRNVHTIDLPALTLAHPVHVQVIGRATATGFEAVTVKEEMPVMFVPVEVLMSTACDRTYGIKMQQPCCAVISSDGGSAAYPKPEFNGGRPWKDLILRQLPQQTAALASVVLGAITENGKRIGDQSLITIELVRP